MTDDEIDAEASGEQSRGIEKALLRIEQDHPSDDLLAWRTDYEYMPPEMMKMIDDLFKEMQADQAELAEDRRDEEIERDREGDTEQMAMEDMVGDLIAAEKEQLEVDDDEKEEEEELRSEDEAAILRRIYVRFTLPLSVVIVSFEVFDYPEEILRDRF